MAERKQHVHRHTTQIYFSYNTVANAMCSAYSPHTIFQGARSLCKLAALETILHCRSAALSLHLYSHAVQCTQRLIQFVTSDKMVHIDRSRAGQEYKVNFDRRRQEFVRKSVTLHSFLVVVVFPLDFVSLNFMTRFGAKAGR